jgi:hypothetical protein
VFLLCDFALLSGVMVMMMFDNCIC